MSEVLKNKQILHIASEIVIILGVCFYFSKKNKQVVTQIEILAKKIEEQQELINKHEQIIHRLVQVCNSQQTMLENSNFSVKNKNTTNDEGRELLGAYNKKHFHMPTSNSSLDEEIFTKKNNVNSLEKINTKIRENIETPYVNGSKKVKFNVPRKTVKEIEEIEEESEEESEDELEEGSDLEDDFDVELREELRELEDLENGEKKAFKKKQTITK